MSEKARQLLRLLKSARGSLDIPQVCEVLGVTEREFRQLLRELEKAGEVKVNLQIEVLRK